MNQGLIRGVAAAVCLALFGCNVQEIRNTNAHQHAQRGEGAFASKDLDRALAEFEQAVRLNPQMATGYAGIGRVHKQRGDFAQAAGYFAEAVRLDPFDYPSAFNLGESYELLAAKAADKLRQLEAAIRAYLHACDLKPDSFEARAHLADCYQKSGNFDAAAESYSKAVTLAPKNALVYNNLGAVYHAQGKYYEAIRAYKSSLEIDTNQPVVHVNLGTTYLKQDRISAATGSFELAIKMDPKLALAHERLGYCRYRHMQYERAMESYNRAAELDGKLADAYGGRGIVEMTLYLTDRRRNEFRDRAIEDWHRSLELEPEQPRLRGLLTKYEAARKSAEPDIVSSGMP